MSFSRAKPVLLVGEALEQAMRGIGMRVGPATSMPASSDIELTLCSVSAAALPSDYRLLGVLVAWLEVHHARVNVPRLKRLIRNEDGPVFRAWWASIAKWLKRGDARWKALVALYKGKPLFLEDAEIGELQLQRLGSDPRFEKSALRIHAKLLRARTEDVDDPVQLARRHPLYLRRLQLGSNYRADVWAALDQAPHATVADIARSAGCAYETARLVAEDWRTARAAQAA
jgi:hypothetical protein